MSKSALAVVVVGTVATFLAWFGGAILMGNSWQEALPNAVAASLAFGCVMAVGKWLQARRDNG